MNKILLADNQELFRIGMTRILASEEDFHLVAQCADLERLLLLVDAYRSSIVLFASALRPEYRSDGARKGRRKPRGGDRRERGGGP
jgi:DNA-binding NarL/FixJ family response regulator